MKIVEINAVPYGSTGRIARSICKIASSEKDSAFFCYSWTKNNKIDKTNEILIGNFFSKVFNMFLSKITGFEGVFSYISTKIFINRIKKIDPDIIHLHILHCWYINIDLLIDYLINSNAKVFWTFHDCWAFTGHCPHFLHSKCDKWKSGCFHCPEYKNYPNSFFDNSKKMYRIKSKWAVLLQNTTIVVPSKWLFNLLKDSFYKNNKALVINNGIDLSVFKPVPFVSSSFPGINREKIIILGVSYIWSERKGLNDFIELSKIISNNYQIVLVGRVDKHIINKYKITFIERTQDQQQLAMLYSVADVFVNPTHEDNFPTVNIESLACGTPVVTYDCGGATEMIDSNCGISCKTGDIDSLYEAIQTILKRNRLQTKKACIDKATNYDMNEKYMEYIKLFRE